MLRVPRLYQSARDAQMYSPTVLGLRTVCSVIVCSSLGKLPKLSGRGRKEGIRVPGLNI